MTRPVAARGGRMLGRGLLTVANVITVAAPFAADWNDSHIFNERWPAHARFHGVTALAMAATLSSLNIWSIWSSASDRTTARSLRRRSRWPTGRRSLWPLWFLAPRSMTRRTLSRVWQACRRICWVRRLPPRRRPLDGSSTAGLPLPRADDQPGSVRRVTAANRLTRLNDQPRRRAETPVC